MASLSTSAVDGHNHQVVSNIREKIANNHHDELPYLIHECMNEYRDNKLDRRCYAEAIRVLKQDSRCSEMVTKMELGICPLITASPRRPPTPGYLEMLYEKACLVKRKATDHLINHHHPWKIQKYTLVLQELRRNLERHNLTPTAYFMKTAMPMTQVNAAVHTLLNAIYQPDFELYRDDRVRYQQGFVLGLRDILQNPEFSLLPALDKAAFSVHYIVMYRYTGTQLFNWQSELVDLFIREGRKSLLNYYGLDEDEADRERPFEIPLEWQFHGIDFAPKSLKARPIDLQVGKFKGHVGIDFDPSRRTRIPTVGYTWGERINLQIGTPTVQPLAVTDQTVIAPEFDYFIASLRRTSQSLLYINLQINFGEGAEKSRSDQLTKLQAKYPDALKLVMFDMDSDFYKQKVFPEVMGVEVFEQEYCRYLLDPYGPYRIPDVDVEFIRVAFRDIKTLFFPHQTDLTKNERQQFIDLFHGLLAMTYIQKYPTQYFTIVCKDGLDRAGSVNALIRDFIFLLEDMEKDPITKVYQSVFIHSLPIMTKKIAMLEERRNRYLSLLDHLSDPVVQAGLKVLLKQRFVSYGSFFVERHPNQRLIHFGGAT